MRLRRAAWQGLAVVCFTALGLVTTTARGQDLDHVRKTASSIHEQGKFPTELHRKEFTNEELSQGVSDFLGNVFGGLGDAARATAPVAKWGFIILAVVLVVLFALALYRLRPRLDVDEKNKEPKRGTAIKPKADAPSVDALSDDGLSELLAKGLYAQAVAYLLRLMIHELGYDRGIEQQSLTPREVVSVVRSDELSSAVIIAERVRFAGQPASSETIDELRSLRADLVSQRKPDGER